MIALLQALAVSSVPWWRKGGSTSEGRRARRSWSRSESKSKSYLRCVSTSMDRDGRGSGSFDWTGVWSGRRGEVRRWLRREGLRR
jgi:hypothetical protein